MEVVGDGMIARAFVNSRMRMDDVVVFAAGVSRSTTTEAAEFHREADLLHKAISDARAARRRLLYFSTASAHLYGNGDGSPRSEEDPVRPTSAYGRHKAAMEERIRTSGVDHLILRVTEVVGPHQRRHQLLPALFSQVSDGVVTVYRGARRDLVDVADLVTIAAELLSGDLRHATVNIASGHPVTAEEIVSYLMTLSGRAVTKVYVDTPANDYNVSTKRMAQHAPSTARMGFSPTYYRNVIDRYYRP
ncbi:NAD-dependent epimerase/dehydratase family protein [Nonomuraea angiospora]|uniref:NAD-dependent epimerase/dehydratase family protein n=1 Tax=Nonomuraea angiospora TaxID=46172 RepID=UPI0029BC4250|nr:NAD-dependent epimerase/dehydratase family protein [Nonomuraea angiospora]MDX3103788.1 NAD-dependent epimerase/dehydratase family protein [Nonomuraea angiospora]